MLNKDRLKGLYVVLSTTSPSTRGLRDLAEEVAKGEPSTVQLRDKSGIGQGFFELARDCFPSFRERGIPFLINDRVDIAMAMGADGVYLGQEDFPIQEAKKLLGMEAIVGGTACTLEEALEVEKAGADYVSLGHIFPTQSKPKDYPPLGLETLRTVAGAIQVPLFCIGGIKSHNLASCIEAGACGIALITAVSMADDPCEATREMEALCQQALQKRFATPGKSR